VTSDQERARARQLSAESVAAGNATGWFERLYAEAEAGVTVVPWADGRPDPNLVEWADRAGSAGSDGSGRRALVVGCGLGYDAEFLAGRGFAVTAFDLSPTAIAAANRLYPDSPVTYLAADLLDLPAAWAGGFDLVVEAYTIQPLYGPVRERALAALSGPVAPGGSLLVIARATDEDEPVRDPAMMPWPLTPAELTLAGGPLRIHRIEKYADDRCRRSRARDHAAVASLGESVGVGIRGCHGRAGRDAALLLLFRSAARCAG
jgi:2-polyprenyl-3-methyl-5-hydroxy-6-metoxy-1,4-benzoquinol methylase